MRKNIRWITETALLLALLVVLQAATKGFGQLVTGSCVNAVLALTVLLCGMASGVTIALISPVLAYFLGIAPQLVVVPAIMAGNVVFVVLLRLIAGEALGSRVKRTRPPSMAKAAHRAAFGVCSP